MSTKINLLPWREAHRKTKNTEFFVVLGICSALVGLLGFGGFKYAEDKVNFQNERNGRLNNEIALLAEELKEIKELEQTKANLLARMEIIQQLQSQRPQIVHTFHEVATRIPDGVFLQNLKQSDNKRMIIEGRAESNARVSALMRTLDRSDYFSNPKLEVIEADQDDGVSTFRLVMSQVSPHAETTEEEDNGL